MSSGLEPSASVTSRPVGTLDGLTRGVLQSTWAPLVVAACGLGISLLVLAVSAGSNDVMYWHVFASHISTEGVFALYADESQFNHPPLMGLYSWICLELAQLMDARFALVFKLPQVVAHAATAWLVRMIWLTRANRHVADWAGALYCWALCPILVSAYHGNTDSLCLSLMMLCVFFLERGHIARAGLAIALAINVKLIPVLVLVPIFLWLRSFKDMVRFSLGGIAGVIPFLIAMWLAGPAFISNVLAYRAAPDAWGVSLIIWQLSPIAEVYFSAAYAAGVQFYGAFGTALLVAAVVCLGVIARSFRLAPSQIGACALTLFLLLAPGFGVQYLIYAAPALFAVSIGWGLAYSTVAGLFAAALYLHFQVESWPFYSKHSQMPVQLALLGFAAWWVLLMFLVQSASRRAKGVLEGKLTRSADA